MKTCTFYIHFISALCQASLCLCFSLSLCQLASYLPSGVYWLPPSLPLYLPIHSSLHPASLCQYSLMAVCCQGCGMRLCRVVSDTWPGSDRFSPAHFHSIVKSIGWLVPCISNSIHCFSARTWSWLNVAVTELVSTALRFHKAYTKYSISLLWFLDQLGFLLITMNQTNQCNVKGLLIMLSLPLLI